MGNWGYNYNSTYNWQGPHLVGCWLQFSRFATSKVLCAFPRASCDRPTDVASYGLGMGRRRGQRQRTVKFRNAPVGGDLGYAIRNPQESSHPGDFFWYLRCSKFLGWRWFVVFAVYGSRTNIDNPWGDPRVSPLLYDPNGQLANDW